ncbi:hypothetical protein K505DRAFT_382660 [Melanomma pulvis-pyrius CBS 109.77]|uniref:F-box domain-containing protein n=1 Tax=Melanomma pulvis-pyrius CBS 109.77 TaxID=1314802 RepID=A0A6A6XFG1_9PLEO|nr:hypothetical protein K505DRAFT_382660 [Melanomma pulvis-pyrius CBS 109.77]
MTLTDQHRSTVPQPASDPPNLPLDVSDDAKPVTCYILAKIDEVYFKEVNEVHAKRALVLINSKWWIEIGRAASPPLTSSPSLSRYKGSTSWYDLPPELHLRVFEYCLHFKNFVNWRNHSIHLRRVLKSMLLVNKMFYNEAVKIYYSKNYFEIRTGCLSRETFMNPAPAMRSLIRNLTLRLDLQNGLSTHTRDGFYWLLDTSLQWQYTYTGIQHLTIVLRFRFGTSIREDCTYFIKELPRFLHAFEDRHSIIRPDQANIVTRHINCGDWETELSDSQDRECPNQCARKTAEAVRDLVLT